MLQQVKISKIKGNPINPRVVKNDKYEKLKGSIEAFPEMLEKRPIIVDEDFMILGGNMRWKACVELGLKEVWVNVAVGWTQEQKDEFIIKDNGHSGEWDWDVLANNWDVEQLSEWGLEAITNDWDDLDYIDEEIDKPELKSNNIITVKIPSELEDERNAIEDGLKDYLSTNFSGCEVQ